MTVRTGRTEIGTGMTGFYTQVVAEELCVRPEAITLITGDTDRTSDGGYSAGFLSGAVNLRKAAAYTREALLRLAASRLGASPAALISLPDCAVDSSSLSGVVSHRKKLRRAARE